MNMFLPVVDVQEIPKHYCDVHLRKMILEQTQLLCNAHRVLDGHQGFIKVVDKKGKEVLKPYKYVLYHMGENNNFPQIYKLSHINHPISKWVRTSHQNYVYAYRLLVSMHNEYEYRFNKKHKSKTLLVDIKNVPTRMKNVKLTPFIACVSDTIKEINVNVDEKYKLELVKKYQEWCSLNKEIINGKVSKRIISVKWTNRDIPDYVDEKTLDLINKYGHNDLYRNTGFQLEMA